MSTPANRATVRASAPAREFEFTDRDFRCLREVVARHAGIALSDAKREMVYGRLARRLRELGLGTFAEYCARLEAHRETELGHLINAITTNLTAFFRERHHFDYLRGKLLPELAARRHEARLRIWSAGCSTGAEPYSIAMTLEDTPAVRGWDVRILATDIDTEVLATASRGVYAEREIEGVPAASRSRWFLRGKGANAGRVKVKPVLRERIEFRPLNLLAEWTADEPFDVIFCRNVVIYFDKPTQRRLFDRFAHALVPEGHLFIGHSESLFKVSDRFVPLGQTIYQKKS